MLRLSNKQLLMFEREERRAFAAHAIRQIQACEGPQRTTDWNIDLALRQLETAIAFGLTNKRHALCFLLTVHHLGVGFWETRTEVRNVLQDPARTAQSKSEYLIDLVNDSVETEAL